jgi:hypothetical protein
MPSKSEAQRRAAGRELGMRREGKVRRDPDAKRPFAGASEEQLRAFASKPTSGKDRKKSIRAKGL